MREIDKRTEAAIGAIRKAFGTPADEYGATLFVRQHMEEMPESYWHQHLGTANPEPQAVLNLLELRGHWGEEDDLEYFDFTLPGDVTQYVVSVHFDDAGNIDEINMES